MGLFLPRCGQTSIQPTLVRDISPRIHGVRIRFDNVVDSSLDGGVAVVPVNQPGSRGGAASGRAADLVLLQRQAVQIRLGPWFWSRRAVGLSKSPSGVSMIGQQEAGAEPLCGAFPGGASAGAVTR